MNILSRNVQKLIEDRLFRGKVIILYGQRRVGKTTLCKEILKKYGTASKYINCENLSVQSALAPSDAVKLRNFLGTGKLFVLDEAQVIPNIGLTLKLLVDTYPDIQIIATGSSSFDLANTTGEPLVGRAYTFCLYPFSIQEISDQLGRLELEQQINNLLVYGSMPSIFGQVADTAEEELSEISSRYLYKDILELEDVRNPKLLKDLIQLLALQIGQEVSLRELSNTLNVAHTTIARYLDLLEKTFVIFSLKSFSRNLRKEITKSYKYYFWDLGIRNSLIQNFNDLSLRLDAGSMWENFCISERIKFNANRRYNANYYFWRTYDQKEIDFIEEKNGLIKAFEFKWNPKKQPKFPRQFLQTYPNSQFKVVNKSNYWEEIASTDD